jgi:hypothetical protein
MHALRLARHLPRFVLAWFALSLFVGIVSPMVNPQSVELVCSASGAFKVVVKSADGVKQVASHTLDCPLCLAVGAPPPVQAHFTSEPAGRTPYLLQSNASAKTRWLSAAPLPARGPPLFS